jgi:hypothetical protein
LLFYLAKGEIFVPKKLNDTQIAELVFKHTNGTSISALAKEYGIGWETAKNYIVNNREIQEKSETIKNETITQWLESHKGDLTSILDQITKLLPEKLSKASVKELFGGLKILTDLGVNINKDGDGTDEPISVNITFADTSGDKNE